MNITIKNLELFCVHCGLGSICLAAAIFARPMGGFTVGFAMVAGMFYGAALGCVNVNRIKDGD